MALKAGTYTATLNTKYSGQVVQSATGPLLLVSAAACHFQGLVAKCNSLTFTVTGPNSKPVRNPGKIIDVYKAWAATSGRN